MTTTHPTIRPEDTLAELAAHWAFASRVFQRHDLDYCCQGRRTLADACRERRLPLDQVLGELRRELVPHAAVNDWIRLPTAQLVAHLVDHFHRSHRDELPRLLTMAEKVERVHHDKPSCPTGLASPTDAARVDRQCDVLRFRISASLASSPPEEPPAGTIVSDPSSYWSEHADASDAALIKGIDLDTLSVRDCREAGFYDN